MKKDKRSKENTYNLIVSFDREVIDEYKIVCENQGFNMSQRVRNFINKEIKDFKQI